MSQVDVDNKNPSTAKRARTDGDRREDDWTCPGCGNVNFSFRKTCNMHNCTQPRPADHNAKPALRPMQPPQPSSSNPPYGGSRPPPSSLYLGMPPYNSSVFNGSSVPPYGTPYQPMPVSGPPPYIGGPMMGNGGMYGVLPPIMDHYGMSLSPIPTPPMGPRPRFSQDDKSQKKDVVRDNDWTCPNCGNVNFSFRKICNMKKCSTPKPGAQPPKPEQNSMENIPDGSWKCEQCGNLNFPFRTKCNTKNCGSNKPSEEKVPDGSWKCEQCGNVNFPFRTKCNTKNCGSNKPSEVPDGSWKCVQYGNINFPFWIKFNMNNCGAVKPSEEKIPDGSWKCEQCGNINFPFRTKCNTKNCGSSKPSEEKIPEGKITEEKIPEEKIPDGSWKCEQCGNLNFPFRTKCNTRSCGSIKPSEEKKSPSPTVDGNEQICE